MNLLAISTPSPLFFFLAALLVALIAYVLHRWTALSGLAAAVGSLWLGWIAFQSPARWSEAGISPFLTSVYDLVPWTREWALTSSSTALLALVFVLAGFAFLLSLPASQGWSFYPFGMGMLGVLSLSITAQQYTYQVLFMWMAANLAVFVLAGGRAGATMGALRFLVLTTLAAFILLVLPHYLQMETAGLRAASNLMLIGFSILLMMPPFHGQLVAASAYTAPMAPAMILSAFPLVTFSLFFSLSQASPALLADGWMFDLCRWLGVGAVAVGGAAAIGQRRWGSLVGYAALVDWGAGLIALGQGTQAGAVLAVQMLIWRALSLLLTGSGLTILFQATGRKDDMDRCAGLLHRRPLNVLTLLVGLLSLAGFPLTPGATGRWPLIQELLASDPPIAGLLILAGSGVVIGALGGLHACMGRPSEDAKRDLGQDLVGLTIGLCTLWLVGALFLHPQPWLEMLRHAFIQF